MLLNRTFLRSRQEQKQLETAVRSSFLCFEGMSDMFLNDLLTLSELSKLNPGDVVTCQGERVSRFLEVVSGSIGGLEAAAAAAAAAARVAPRSHCMSRVTQAR